MATKKKAGAREPSKAGRKLIKLSALPKDQAATISLEDLWVMEPLKKGIAGRAAEGAAMMARARYCRCRNVCIV
jgi:hypothetical protein